MSKKKILYHSNHSRLFSGFGKNAKNILKYLASTDKYEIVELANGVTKDHPDLETLPWKAVGGLPNDQNSINRMNSDPGVQRAAAYGSLRIDEIMKEEKPDVYIGVEDIWGLSGYTKKSWWQKINSIIWTTIDSLPVLPDAIDSAAKSKNYYVWSSFAQKELNNLGYENVKTLHGSIDDSFFYKKSFEEKELMRNFFGIPLDSFIIGFVFRNQLRKSVPNLLEGFKKFKKNNPQSNAKLLLHTNFSEGWDIPRLIKEKDIDPSDVLCTYFCKKCSSFEVRPFSGNGLDCRFCGSKGSMNTISIASAVSEDDLNNIYNLMDVYCHPFTSGGQEIPLQEAKLCELITLCTNYSCGIDSCSKDSAGLPLDWNEYREPGTQFIKASTCPESISSNLEKVFKMDEIKKSQLGKKAREYILSNYSINVIGKKIEDIIDKLPDHDYDFNFEKELRDPNYSPPDIDDNTDWLLNIYKNILKSDLPKSDNGVMHWLNSLNQGATRESILNHFRQVATSENESIKKEKTSTVDFSKIIQNEGKKKALIVCSGSEEDVIYSLRLFKSFNSLYPDYDLFFACKEIYHSIVSSNPYIYKILPYSKEMENEILMTSNIDGKEAYFNYYCNLNILTDKYINYRGVKNKTFNLYEQA